MTHYCKENPFEVITDSDKEEDAEEIYILVED